ncbi:hypothetical protein GGI07_005957, partial [Coemansia sp. Benny D115]
NRAQASATTATNAKAPEKGAVSSYNHTTINTIINGSNNPFDIISSTFGLGKMDLDEEGNSEAEERVVVVGQSAELSDSDNDAREELVFGRDYEEHSDGECEYDPSMYRIAPGSLKTQKQQQQQPSPLSSPALSQLQLQSQPHIESQVEDRFSERMDSSASLLEAATASSLGQQKRPQFIHHGSIASLTPNAQQPQTGDTSRGAHVLAKAKAKAKSASASSLSALSFTKPPETLSLRTHVSITSDTPLAALADLDSESSFLALTSLCPDGPTASVATGNGSTASSNTASLSGLADALLYWEATSPTCSEAEIRQSLQSLFHLQSHAPQRYPFVYL